MSATRFYYLSDKSFNSSGDVESMFFTESSSNNQINGINNKINKTTEEDKDYDDTELMPYTPNSVDRSSVGSIPWADDAIKQNQLDWERIERLLAGQETPKSDELELAQEILEWQQKFPSLRNSKSFKLQQSFDSSRTNMDTSLNIDTLSNDSLEYSDNELEDGLATPTMNNYNNRTQQQLPLPQQRKSSITDLAQQLSRNLRISSVPLTWRQRHNHITDFTRTIREQSELSTTSAAMSPPPRPPPRRQSPTFNSLIIAPAQPKLMTKPKQAHKLMPPLLNVIESKRRFRGLTNNQSFVQLTQLQQTKSAAVMQQNARRNQQTAWHVPLAAANIGKRFLSNRNSVVLPAINLRRINEHRSTDNASSASSASSFSEGGVVSLQDYKQYVQQEPAYYLQQPYVVTNRKNYANGFSSTTPSTSGRSISAAVHHPRIELSAFYLPYSAATKFKSFNKI